MLGHRQELGWGARIWKACCIMCPMEIPDVMLGSSRNCWKLWLPYSFQLILEQLDITFRFPLKVTSWYWHWVKKKKKVLSAATTELPVACGLTTVTFHFTGRATPSRTGTILPINITSILSVLSFTWLALIHPKTASRYKFMVFMAFLGSSIRVRQNWVLFMYWWQHTPNLQMVLPRGFMEILDSVRRIHELFFALFHIIFAHRLFFFLLCLAFPQWYLLPALGFNF